MPTLDSDHNHYAVARHRQNSLSSGYGLSTQPAADSLNPAPRSPVDGSLPTLPAYTYNLSPTRRPVVSNTFKEHASSAGVNGFAHDVPRDDDSSDPHEFYRRYQNQFATGTADGLGQADIVVTKREDSMVVPRQQRRSSPISARANGSKLLPLASRVPSSHIPRHPSAASVDHAPLNNAKSSPALSNTARNRQTSLKDLVHRFNQTPDEVPPLPRKTASRSTSTNSNPSASVSYGKARTLSQSKSSGFGTSAKGSALAQDHTGKAPRLHQRRGRNSEDVTISQVSAASAISPHMTRPEPNAYASQSLTDLTPEGNRSIRKPLFGEVSAVSIDRGDLGYGIPVVRRRRGSEGSMHSPNPMFPVERHSRRISPTSPTAWYLGVTPTLEEIKMEKTVPSLPPSMHRRTRSDFTGAPPRPPPPQIATIPVASLAAPPQPIPPSPTSTRAFRRDSQSRIPVSSRRLSVNSDSGNSTPSTRNNSAMGRNSGHTMPPKKGPMSIPKPGHKARSPVRNAKPHSSRNSPRRGDYSPGQRPATSPRLAAYITAPLPKKSPPLRSSRPRQPVSSASTSASRARAVDRLSSHEGAHPKAARDHRSKRLPELGGVDFAARRQKIQQAFTKTVKDVERQEVEAEKKRMSMAQENQSRVPETTVEPEPSDTQLDDRQDAENPRPVSPSPMEEAEEVLETAAEESSKSERELTINTDRLSERSVLDLSMEDSPTLGGFNRFANLNRVDEGIVTPPSDPEPLSAVTAGTSDTVETFFDHEPQEEPPDSYQEHRSLLSHIMSMRDTSPASPTSVRRPPVADDSTSEKDDRESIQIMLSETPVLERAPFAESSEDKSRDSVSNEEPGSRWSMSSWTSSNRSKDVKSFDHERDAPMERIDENSPSRPVESAHLSLSSASSEQTPQQWSPATFASPQTDRTTMDSDAYSTINRVLDHYHDSNVVSPELINDMQQRILTQSPELARLGGWDPKKVTQLYLQELARGRYKPSIPTPNPLRIPARKPVDPHLPGLLPDDGITASPEKESFLEESIHEVQELPADECSPPAVTLDVNHSEYNPQRASLNAPADWEMSPSISDWIHLQAVDSPQDDRPIIPPKDWKPAEKEDGESNTQTLARSSREFRPQLPEIKSTGEGLGIKLAINVTSPQDDDSPTIPLPPLPNHLPPPPPEESVDQDVVPITQIRSPPSPNISSRHIPSSSYPKPFQIGDASVPLPVSSEPPRRSSISTPTAQESTPLPMSQARKSTGATSTVSDTSGQGPSPSHDQKRLTRRRNIIKELVDTEHSFGQDMKVVDDIYRGTSNVIIISAEDVKTLFGNSDQIVAFSTGFLDALKQAAKGVYVLPKSKRWRSNRTSNATSYSGNTDDQSSMSGTELNDDEKDRKTFIGEAFGMHMAHMEKVYSDYLRNHDAANHKLQALQKNQKVQIWLKECRAYAHDLTSAWDLDSLLVKPVQRILKYPLLLDQLLEVTPENHPDYNHLDVAAREMKGISMRINEMKKRADLMEQVANNRKRKESDVRIGLSKAFGRRAEKLRQQVGLTDTVEDKGYAAVSEKFGSHFFQLQVVMRDVEMYVADVQTYMDRFNDFVLAIEAHIDVGQSSYPEVESKWRKFRMSTREIANTALVDHILAVRKNVIEPMTTLLKLQEGPQKLMQKRNKRILDYARFKALKDRGEKPDKKTVEQGEQFMAINETLKDELPKLFSLTKKLVEACLSSFVQLQLQWHIIWRRKLSQAIDDCKVKGPSTPAEIIESFTGDFSYVEAQVLSLGICNGSMLADAVNLVSFLSPATTLNGDGNASPRHASSLDLTKRRTLSISSDASPMLPQPDFGTRGNATFFGVDSGLQLGSGAYTTSNTIESNRRMRASSTVSSQGPRTPELSGAYRSYSNSNTPGSNTVRPTTAITRTTTEPSPSLSRQSLENSNLIRSSEDTSFSSRPPSGSTYPHVVPNTQQRVPSPAARYSGFFSSAMPMSDSPPTESPTDLQSGVKEFVVIFLAASVYEFNIDRARREAGYPYLTYVAGEIFDVIGEKGELWLAKNQDDSTNQVGWIWNKHFVKLAS